MVDDSGFVVLLDGLHDDDVLAAVSPTGRMRMGNVRVRDARDKVYVAIQYDIYAIACGDQLLVATALGENAFKRGDE